MQQSRDRVHQQNAPALLLKSPGVCLSGVPSVSVVKSVHVSVYVCAHVFARDKQTSAEAEGVH